MTSAGRCWAPTTCLRRKSNAGVPCLFCHSLIAFRISTTFIRFETLRFSSVMEDACTHFEEQSPRNPQNILAVKLTRLLHLSEGIATGMPVDPGLNPKDLSICPLSIYIKGSQANLDKFWELLPADMQDDGMPSRQRPKEVSANVWPCCSSTTIRSASSRGASLLPGIQGPSCIPRQDRL